MVKRQQQEQQHGCIIGGGGGIGIDNICKDQRNFFPPFSLFKKVCYIIWEKKQTFWLTAGISSVSQHGDNIALNTGWRRRHDADSVNTERLLRRVSRRRTSPHPTRWLNWARAPSLRRGLAIGPKGAVG